MGFAGAAAIGETPTEIHTDDEFGEPSLPGWIFVLGPALNTLHLLQRSSPLYPLFPDQLQLHPVFLNEMPGFVII
jgi:hypothetical protein